MLEEDQRWRPHFCSLRGRVRGERELIFCCLLLGKAKGGVWKSSRKRREFKGEDLGGIVKRVRCVVFVCVCERGGVCGIFFLAHLFVFQSWSNKSHKKVKDFTYLGVLSPQSQQPHFYGAVLLPFQAIVGPKDCLSFSWRWLYILYECILVRVSTIGSFFWSQSEHRAGPY